MKIAIINFGSGNLTSIVNFFKRNFHCQIKLFNKPSQDIEDYQILVIPGVGHFGHAATYLRSKKLDKAIMAFSNNKKPIIGICLGAQLLTHSSEEAKGIKGLGLINAKCISLSSHPKYKDNIPRIGWSGIEGCDLSSYYFVHSYYIKVLDKSLLTTYSHDGVTAMVETDHILAMQFHPEKSDISGENITKKFLKKHV